MSDTLLRYLPRVGEEADEIDRQDALPHPREMLDLVGHKEQELALLDAYRSKRMHHAWILAGPPGIGKATLAYRFARFVLAHPDPDAPDVRIATNLDVPGHHRVAHLVSAKSHPDLYALHRVWNEKGKKHFTDIRVDDVRKIANLFHSTPGEGGWRIAIIDNAEDLNNNSANALLKMLEEPPSRSLFLIISNAAGRLLPTIRSRCRMLPIRPLREAEVASVVAGVMEDKPDIDLIRKSASLAGGSVRRAISFLDDDSLGFRGRLDTVLQQLPKLDEKALLAIAEETTKRDGMAFPRFIEAMEDFLSANLDSNLTTPKGSVALLPFAELWQKLASSVQEVEAYNLDRRPLVLGTIAELALAINKSRITSA